MELEVKQDKILTSFIFNITITTVRISLLCITLLLTVFFKESGNFVRSLVLWGILCDLTRND